MRLNHLFEKISDLILPPICPITREPVAQQGDISPTLWRKLTFITDPMCSRCGYPFPFDQDAGDSTESECASCLKSPPLYDKARSALKYDDGARPLILQFKHGDKTHIAGQFARWITQQSSDLLTQSDLIIPVPVHRLRLLKRRYNQAALIADKLSLRDGQECLLDGMERIHSTPPQSGDRKARQKNVKNAFAVNERYRTKMAGKTVALIDDVYTTGATVNSCAQTLLNTGVSKVYVLTVARVVRDGS